MRVRRECGVITRKASNLQVRSIIMVINQQTINLCKLVISLVHWCKRIPYFGLWDEMSSTKGWVVGWVVVER